MRQLPRLSQKEAVVLELLVARGEMYGLELVQRSSGRLKRGTVYVTLGRMEDKGLVRSYLEERGRSGGPPRRLYEITGIGHRTLVASEAAERAFTDMVVGPSTVALAMALAPGWAAFATADQEAGGVLGTVLVFVALAVAWQLMLLVIGRVLASRVRERRAEREWNTLLELASRTHWKGSPQQQVAAIIEVSKVLGKLLFTVQRVEKAGRRVYRAPGGRLRSLARLIFTKRTYTLVFDPLLADLYLDYFEALEKKSMGAARWVRVKYTMAFFAAILERLPISVASLVRLVLRVG